MADKKDKVFPEGLYAKYPNVNAPDFIIANISLKLEELIPWIEKQKEAGETWVNITLLESKDGSLYPEVDTWKPDTAKSKSARPTRGRGKVEEKQPPVEVEDEENDDLPF